MKTTHTTGSEMLKEQTSVNLTNEVIAGIIGTKGETKPYQSITIDDGYNFKGSINSRLHILVDSDGLITITSDYGEVMSKCYSLKSFAEFLMKLSNDELA